MSVQQEHLLILEGDGKDAGEAIERLKSAGYRVRAAGTSAATAAPLPLCRDILESVQEGVWVSDADDVVRYANRGMESLTGLCRAEIAGKSLFAAFDGGWAEELRPKYLKVKESLVPARYEVRARLAGGREGRLGGWLTPLLEGGRFAGMVGTARDVTASAQAEEGLRRTVESQELRMQEIQHRVKNSLNVVSSILRIEKDGLADEKAQAVFADAITRIRSIAAVYEHLARSDDHTSVAFDLYVRDIVDSVFASESVGAGIALRSELEPARLDAKRAVPLGLILNELLTNALKYAYPSGGPGEIRVALAAEDGFLSLRVEDDGAGFAPGFDPASSTGMGMTLVRMLSEQVGGELEVEGRRGTRISVRLPL